ncbi:HNH homing endonuclease [Klebsiella phage K1-ULIP33]|uniref:HNH homing endonuclease n=1 Tax=Klebsiella phage K1-ULIP33 TaxID=2307015 RepID=A0A4P6DBJ2_9CAUD|nr:HNH homing endonuclease [Klebsiella phage K1-ULIP33]
MEIWKVISEFPDYAVSSHGRVKSLRYNRIMSGGLDADGYVVVTLRSNKKPKTQKVHRLVATAFISNPLCLPEVNHKSEIKTDNFVQNLEWCTSQYNTEYSQAKTYEILTPKGERITVTNLRKFCRDNNLCQSNMNKVFNGKASHHKGYRKYNGGI